MSNYNLLGLDTLEMIELGYEKSSANAWGLYDFEGPVLDFGVLQNAKYRKRVLLPKELLSMLYERFEVDPTGRTTGAGCLVGYGAVPIS